MYSKNAPRRVKGYLPKPPRADRKAVAIAHSVARDVKPTLAQIRCMASFIVRRDR